MTSTYRTGHTKASFLLRTSSITSATRIIYSDVVTVSNIRELLRYKIDLVVILTLKNWSKLRYRLCIGTYVIPHEAMGTFMMDAIVDRLDDEETCLHVTPRRIYFRERSPYMSDILAHCRLDALTIPALDLVIAPVRILELKETGTLPVPEGVERLILGDKCRTLPDELPSTLKEIVTGRQFYQPLPDVWTAHPVTVHLDPSYPFSTAGYIAIRF